MTRKWLVFYLANWYAFAVCGALMSLQHPSGTWLADLPWTSWGTELAQALAEGEPVSGGALWILMGASLAAIGVSGSLVASLAWLAARDEAAPVPQQDAPAPSRAGAGTPAASIRPEDVADLVEDPRLRSLIAQLHTRLG